MLQSIWNTTTSAIRIGCFVHLVHHSVYEVTETHGESMLPTLNYTGDYVHVNKYYRRGRNVQIGDLIVATKPTDPGQRVCKRITGMPGDVICVDPSSGDYDRYITVPKGHCWVTGDNLTQSLDSRSYGVLPLGLIKGRIFAAHNYETWNFKWLTNNLKS